MNDWRARLPGPVVACADSFASGVEDALGNDLVALWYHGAMCFEGSEDVITDIDFHAVVATPFDQEQVRQLDEVRARMREEHGWLGDELDGYFVLEEHARSSTPPPTQLDADVVDTAWALHRAHWLAGRVIVMHGTGPSTIVAPPSWEEIERALRSELDDCERWAGGGGSAYAVLQACRVLWSLQYRDAVTSKRDAGMWALGDEMPAPWHPLIRAAQRRYREEHTEDDMLHLKDQSPIFIRAMKSFLR